MSDQQAETVAHIYIYSYVVPSEVHTDQDCNFESELFREVLNLPSITKTMTVAYKPSENGMIERFNGTMGRMLKKFVITNKNSWNK